ncbi:putative transcriptional regulator of viral defense system [Kribbella orskensis]|uniref:Transcriptional regulator of viral defense system n=1 Tax=Kribbella orskensis TaxID=2512216 RepID=A0ABY2BJQ9_9ACTN|nr:MULTISPECIES: type IV toxin-antitoxin system AbiEi family antitoxin domain-containing protein [Kribbella]TCN40229.1 putative transcriptional regulator of viral defense system [Kribbella sp. VKM Ac-2500]TCO22849.1 putative transcriptional regulator of viral defense system [Kribbella orskensis]
MQIAEVAAIADEQWGLVTTAQARAASVSAQSMARLAAEGVLERVTHGVYRVVGAGSPLDDLRAAWLALAPEQPAAARLRAPDAVLSHRSAARYHQLGDLDADRFEFTVATRKQSKRPDVRFHRESLSPADWQITTGLPVTTIVKTISDLAKTHTDGGHLAGVVRDAMALNSVTAEELSSALAPYAHHYGQQLGHGRALLNRLLDEAGIPKATQQAAELAAPGPSPADAALLHALALLDPRVPRDLRNRAAHVGLSTDELRQLQALLGITDEPEDVQEALRAAYEARAKLLEEPTDQAAT